MRRANTQIGLSTQPSAVRSSGRFSRRKMGLTTISISFALLQILLNFYCIDADIPELDYLSGVFLWIPITLFPKRFGLGALITFVSLTFLVQLLGFPVNTPETLRLAFFGAILVTAVHTKPPQSPFYISCILWVSALLVNSLLHGFDIAGFSDTNAELIFKIIGEIYVVLCISLLRFSRRIQSFSQTGSYVYSLQVVLTELFGFAVITSGIVLGFILISATGQTLNHLTTTVRDFPNQVLLVVFIFTAVPSLLGKLFARSALLYLKQIRTVGTGANRFTFQSKDFTGFAELQEFLRQVRGTVEKSENDTKHMQLQIKDLSTQLESKEESLKTQTSLADNLGKVIHTCPWGIVALSAEGTVLASNKAFIELLGIDERVIEGKSFTDLEGESAWLKELTTLFLLTCRNYRKLIDQGPMRHTSTSIDHHYLELVFAIIPNPDLNLRPRGTTSFVLPKDTAMALFLRKVPDLREFQLDLLSSSGSENSSAAAREACQRVREDIQGILKHLSITLMRFRDPQAGMPEGDDTQLELLLLLQNIEQHLLKASSSLEKGAVDSSALPGLSVRQDFSLSVHQCLDYLRSVLDLNSSISFSVNQEAITIDPRTPTAALPTLTNHTPVWITAPRSDITALVAHYGLLVRNILNVTADIQVTVGYETIESSTASLIPGSHPGRFVRLALTHPGQSINAAMLKPTNRDQQSAEEAPSLENTLSAFAQQTRKLGGFLTVQSSHARGTYLSVYLPTERRISHASESEAAAHTNGTSAAVKHALIIASDKQLVQTLEPLLRALKYTSELRAPDELFEELSKPADFSGFGFAESAFDIAGDNVEKAAEQDLFSERRNGHRESPPESAMKSEMNGEMKIAPYDVLLFHLESIGTNALLFLKRLERMFPEAKTILLTPTQIKDDHSLSSNWGRIGLPLIEDELEKLLRQVRK